MKNIIIQNVTKKLILFLSIITGLAASHLFAANTPNQKLEETWHFNKEILHDTAQVKQRLLQEGFTEVNIPTNINAEPKSPEQLEQAVQAQFAQLTQIKEAIRNNVNSPEIAEIRNNPQEMQFIQNATIEDVRNRVNAKYANQQQQNQPAATIKGLFLNRGENARATIIFTPGFWPGPKEGFAPFVKIAPQDCNLLFIELSGNKGINSLMGLKKYGLEEHNDIIGAISYTSQETQGKPIILFGWCAGAFFSARTLVKLKEISTRENDLIRNFNIKGLIFDSGFGSIQDVKPGLGDFAKKTFFPCLKDKKKPSAAEPQLGTSAPEQEEGSCIGSLFKGIGSFIADIVIKGAVAVGDLLFGNAIRKNSVETSLYGNIQTISDIKMFFIHSTDDSLAPFNKVKTLADTVKQANPANDTFWETPGDHHASNHVKYKDEYKTRLTNWLNGIVAPVAQKRGNNAANGKGNKTGNSTELNKNIKRMIEILDIFINCIKTGKQPDQKLQQEFMTLLQDPASGIPAETQNQIVQKLQGMEGKTPEEQIKILEEIKEILRNIKPGQNGGANKHDGQQEGKLDNDAGRKRDKDYGANPDYKNPSYVNNPNTNGSTQSTPSSGSSGSGPSSGPGYSGADRSNSNGAGRPSGSHSPSGGGGYNGGYGDGSYYGGGSNKKDKDDEKPNLTAGEYFMLDEEYGDEMEDRPDRRLWFSRG